MVGLRQIDGMPHSPVCKIDFWTVTGPSDVEKY
jgi:hypothetical protein